MTIEELDHYISNHILTKNPRYQDIEGAPFRIGEIVKVLENPSNDETFDIEFANKRGKIKFFEYESGCGQSEVVLKSETRVLLRLYSFC